MSPKITKRPLVVGVAALALATSLAGCFNDPPAAAPRTTVTTTPTSEWTLGESGQAEVLRAYNRYWAAIKDAGSVAESELLSYFQKVAGDDEALKLESGEGLRREVSQGTGKEILKDSRQVHPRVIESTPATAMLYDCQEVTPAATTTAAAAPTKRGMVADMVKNTLGTWRVKRVKPEPKACEI